MPLAAQRSKRWSSNPSGKRSEAGSDSETCSPESGISRLFLNALLDTTRALRGHFVVTKAEAVAS